MLNRTSMQGEVEPLRPGQKVEPVKIQTLDGMATDLQYSDGSKKYLLFVLSTTCQHCERMLPVWNVIAAHKPENCNVLGLCVHSLEQTVRFVTSKNVGFYTVSVEKDTSFSRKYKINGVPETILVERKWGCGEGMGR